MKTELSCIYNVYKPAGISSYDVIRHFKRNLPFKFRKIGHFGTLDPFAEGVLLIAINKASRLNDFIHSELPKTYLAKGILGKFTETGDLTSAVTNEDHSQYFQGTISQFSPEFIQEQLQQKFLGDYWQAPHKFSAAKFEGKKLYQWALEGHDIKKEKKLRKITKLQVVKYEFPHLWIRFEVSSGTYIRSLFTECAQHLGTLGVLDGLVREAVGTAQAADSLRTEQWPQSGEPWAFEQSLLDLTKLLPYEQIQLSEPAALKLSQGQYLSFETGTEAQKYWCLSAGQPSSLVCLQESQLKPLINF